MEKIRQAFINLLNNELNSNIIDLIPLFQQIDLVKYNLEMIEVINQFRKSGDTKLLAYETTCGSDTCSYLLNSRLFTLVGDMSRNYCLLKIVEIKDQPEQIRFCNSIIPKGDLNLNQLFEPYKDDDLPF